MRVFAIHAEELWRDPVWARVSVVSRWMAERGLPLTVFVYPFRAEVAGVEIGVRVRQLAALGHEIGQHTHFYAGRKIDAGNKADDYSRENVGRCMRRDFDSLRRMGVEPKGFTAGAWVVNGAVLDTLIDLRFAYDCSSRWRRPGRRVAALPERCWSDSAGRYFGDGGTLLRLPTLCSLGEWFKWGWRAAVPGGVPYQLVYLHDYDLLSLVRWGLVWCFLAACTRGHMVTAARLASAEGGLGGEGLGVGPGGGRDSE